MVRCLNQTGQPVEFIVTIEREVLVVDDDGNPEVDDDGNFITRPVRRTVRIATAATGLANEIGVLFACGRSPVTIVGLGENLLPTDSAAFVNAEAGGSAGFGVAAGELNPLRWDAGNFDCGDTIIFRAFLSNSVAGGVALQSFLLPGDNQPSEFTGPNTFVNTQEIYESELIQELP
jgi:hypothetical protein